MNNIFESGLKVHFDGDNNCVFYPPDWECEFALGEILLELYETDGSKIKSLVEEYLFRDREVSEENIIDALEEIFSGEIYPLNVVELSMAKVSFATYGRNEDYNKVQSMGEYLDSCMECYQTELDGFKAFLPALVADLSQEVSPEYETLINLFNSVFVENHLAQQIGYELIFDKDKNQFISVYTVYNMLSLLALEFFHMKEKGKVIRKCKNCGGFFVPLKRTDTIYCNRPSPQEPSKTCKQIGAQVSMQNKIQSDECAAEYRKKYQSLNMAYRRAIGEKEREYFKERRLAFTKIGKEKRKQLDSGLISAEEFLKWCINYK